MILFIHNILLDNYLKNYQPVLLFLKKHPIKALQNQIKVFQ